MPLKLLILGGTSEASTLAEQVAGDDRVDATLSLAGRTQSPRLPRIAVRIGGFGGAAGLAAHLRALRIHILVDATHPFATRISANAVAAAEAAGIPLIALERSAWQPIAGDRWTEVADLEAAAAALPEAPERVLLTVGRQSLVPFAAKPQHHYIIRVIDPPDLPPALDRVKILTARGPFGVDGELAVLRDERVDRLVSKNSGGEAGYAKIVAARALGVPVILVARPLHRGRAHAASLDQVMELLLHHASLAKRWE